MRLPSTSSASTTLRTDAIFHAEISLRAYILSWIDYCNSVLASLPAVTLALLQSVMHAAVRLVANLGLRDLMTASMKALHWLPVAYRI